VEGLKMHYIMLMAEEYCISKLGFFVIARPTMSFSS